MTISAKASARNTGGSDRRQEFRPELEGLRGIAVALVLLLHAGLGPLGGGYLGVDLFFVLSGFLITGILLRELETSGRINPWAFYARRVRRILPAAAVAIAATAAVSLFILGPIAAREALIDAAAASLSVSNIRFILSGTDYFAPTIGPSPVLQTWSLGVEEQFYLLWPAVLLLLAALSRRSSSPLRVVRLGLIAISLGSLGIGFAFAATNPTIAFFSLPSRAWELGAGALLAAAPRGRGPLEAALPQALRRGGISIIGLGLLAIAVFGLGPGADFPSGAALVATAGALLLIAAGDDGGVGSWLLTLAPVRFLGRISYSLYLFHWPVLLFGARLLGFRLVEAGSADLGSEAPSTPALTPLPALGLLALAVILATISERFIERPFRAHPALTPRPRITVFGGVATMASVALAVIFVTPRLEGLTVAVPVATSSPPAAILEPSATSGAAPPSPTPPSPTPIVVRPSLAELADDNASSKLGDCFLTASRITPPACRFGVIGSAHRIALIGDSYAAEWFPTLRAIAERRGLELLAVAKSRCPFADLDLLDYQGHRLYRECRTWRDGLPELLRSFDPELIVVSSGLIVPYDRTMGDAATLTMATTRALQALVDLGRPLGVISGVPAYTEEPLDCLAVHLGDPGSCGISRDDAFANGNFARDRAAAQGAGATFVDVSDFFCDPTRCELVRDGIITHHDMGHMTATFAVHLADGFEALLHRLAILREE